MKLFALVLAAFAVLCGLGFASSYEWVSNLNHFQSNISYYVEWDVETTGPYMEYTAVFYKVGGVYQIIPECSFGRVVSGSSTFDCFVTSVPSGFYSARVTTNYQGCAPNSYTAQPDVGYCGDIKEFYLTIS